MLRASPPSSHVVILLRRSMKGADRTMATGNIAVKIHDPDPSVKAIRMELF